MSIQSAIVIGSGTMTAYVGSSVPTASVARTNGNGAGNGYANGATNGLARMGV